jgi:6-phosphogluconolactonase
VSMERENQLQVFDLKDGHLAPTPRFVKTTLADAAKLHPQQIVGPIHLSRDGRFVYLANRADGTMKLADHDVFVGGENNIAVFEIDQKTGEPTLIQNVPTERFHPRTFSLHPDGKMLVAAAIEPMEVRDGDTLRRVPAALTVFRRQADGRLTRVRQYDIETGSDWMFWCGMVALNA